jgi:hypothetical protein
MNLLLVPVNKSIRNFFQNEPRMTEYCNCQESIKHLYNNRILSNLYIHSDTYRINLSYTLSLIKQNSFHSLKYNNRILSNLYIHNNTCKLNPSYTLSLIKQNSFHRLKYNNRILSKFYINSSRGNTHFSCTLSDIEFC